MSALAHRTESPRNHDVCLAFGEPPPATDAWWLSRAQVPAFSGRRIAIPDDCARALRASGGAPLLVEFNGATFGGAALAANDGHYELDLGDALAQSMAEALDEDDGLEIELLEGRGQPTLAIHPYMNALR